jgi:hypothetical protein
MPTVPALTHRDRRRRSSTVGMAILAALTVAAGVYFLVLGGTSPGKSSPNVAAGGVADAKVTAAKAGPLAMPGMTMTSSSVSGSASAGGPASTEPTVDAANRSQQGLAAAAGQPVGAGVQKPAAGLTGSNQPVQPSDVLKNAEVKFGGCLKEYGKTGQCLPLYPPSMADHVQQMIAEGQDPSKMQMFWSCAELRGYFPQGILVRVAGVDPQGLDTNGNGTGCDPADSRQ